MNKFRKQQLKKKLFEEIKEKNQLERLKSKLEEQG